MQRLGKNLGYAYFKESTYINQGYKEDTNHTYIIKGQKHCILYVHNSTPKYSNTVDEYLLLLTISMQVLKKRHYESRKTSLGLYRTKQDKHQRENSGQEFKETIERRVKCRLYTIKCVSVIVKLMTTTLGFHSEFS